MKTYLPLPSHKSQSGHFTSGAGGVSVASFSVDIRLTDSGRKEPLRVLPLYVTLEIDGEKANAPEANMRSNVLISCCFMTLTYYSCPPILCLHFRLSVRVQS